jgi:hypothetical protein
MAKSKKTSKKSLKKTLLKQVEGKLIESLIDFPKKSKENKYKKKIHKAGKILAGSIAIKPIKSISKSDLKKPKEQKQEAQIEAVS